MSDPQPEKPRAEPAFDPAMLTLDKGPYSGLGTLVAEAIVFSFGLLMAWLLVKLGRVMGEALRLSGDWGLIASLAICLYIYMKYSAGLRIENRRLLAYELIVQRMVDQKKAESERAKRTADGPKEAP